MIKTVKTETKINCNKLFCNIEECVRGVGVLETSLRVALPICKDKLFNIYPLRKWCFLCDGELQVQQLRQITLMCCSNIAWC